MNQEHQKPDAKVNASIDAKVNVTVTNNTTEKILRESKQKISGAVLSGKVYLRKFLLFVVFGILAFSIFSGIIYFDYQRNLNELIETGNSVTLDIVYDTNTCDETSPLLVTISNQSKFEVFNTAWDVGASVKGYSGSAMASLYHVDMHYDSNKILAPSESHSLCITAPLLKNGYNPRSVLWNAWIDSIQFSHTDYQKDYPRSSSIMMSHIFEQIF